MVAILQAPPENDLPPGSTSSDKHAETLFSTSSDNLSYKVWQLIILLFSFICNNAEP